MTHQHKRHVGTGVYNAAITLVCFDCRYTAKAAEWTSEMRNRRCPTCRQPLIECGKAFKVPRKSDDRGWKRAREHARGSISAAHHAATLTAGESK